MSDAREALVAVLWEKFGAWPNGPLAAWLTKADCARFADAILAEFDVTERGEVVVERDEARQQVADLRARIEALAADWERHAPDRIVGQAAAADLRALAGSGEQPGEADRPRYRWASHECTGAGDCAVDVHLHGCYADRGNCSEPREHDRPTPVAPDSPHGMWCPPGCGHDRSEAEAPDSARLRGELLHVLDSHGIDTYIDGTGAEVGIQNLITDILAVVGQGVTAEKAWDEGAQAGLDTGLTIAENVHANGGVLDLASVPGAPINPYRKEQS